MTSAFGGQRSIQLSYGCAARFWRAARVSNRGDARQAVMMAKAYSRDGSWLSVVPSGLVTVTLNPPRRPSRSL